MKKSNLNVVIAMSGLAAAAMGLSVNSMGVFYGPVSESLNITTGELGIHITLMMIAMALSGLLLPNLMQKKSLVFIVSLGVTLAVGSTALMGLSNNLWQFMVLGTLKGIGIAMYSMIVIMQVVNNWIIVNKGIITSIIVSFSGIVGAIASIVFGSVIQSYGWQIAYFVAASSILIFCAPTILLNVQLRPGEEILDDHVSDNIRFKFNKLNNRYLMFVILAFIINFICGFVQYLPSFATALGLGLYIGTLMLSMAQIGNVVSKLVSGFIIELIGVYRSAVLLIAIGFGAIVLLITGYSTAFLLIASGLFGVIYALASVSIPLLTEQYFEKKNFAIAFATVAFVMNIGSALSQSMYGFLYNGFGDYRIVASFVGLLFIISLLILVYVNRSKAKKIIRS